MSISNEILESKEFKRFVNKRIIRPGKYFLWSSEKTKPNGFEGDDLCHLLNLVHGAFEHFYLALDVNAFHPLRYKPLSPDTLQTSVSMSLNIDYDGLILFISSLAARPERPAAIRIAWWETMHLIFQTPSTTSMQTDAQYADHIENLMKDILPRLGCQPDPKSEDYPWKL